MKLEEYQWISNLESDVEILKEQVTQITEILDKIFENLNAGEEGNESIVAPEEPDKEMEVKL